MASKRKKRRTAFVPRWLFRAATVGLVPACALGCGDAQPELPRPDLSRQWFFDVAAFLFDLAQPDLSTQPDLSSQWFFDVAAFLFDIAAPVDDLSFSVADAGFRPTDGGADRPPDLSPPDQAVTVDAGVPDGGGKPPDGSPRG